MIRSKPKIFESTKIFGFLNELLDNGSGIW